MCSDVFELRETLALLRREATPFVRLRVAGVLLLVLTSAVLTALGPVALKLMIDAFTEQRQAALEPALLLVVLYVLSQWLARVASELRSLAYRRILRRMFRTLSERLFAHLMQLPLRFHLNRHTGAISDTFASGLEGLQLVLHQMIVGVLPVVAQLVTIILILARMAGPLFLALFCGALLLYAGAFIYSAIRLSKAARSASAARVEASATITDGLLNYETVKYFTAELIVQNRVAHALARSETRWLTYSRLSLRNGLLLASIFAFFLATTTGYATIEVRQGRMTVADFVLVATYMLQLVGPIETLGNAIQGLSQGVAMLEKMVHLFREPPEATACIREKTTRGPGILEFERVTLSYRKDTPVLKDISFTIAPKRTLGIVGPSGSGKSTIVRLLMRLLEPEEGQILLDDIPVTHLALSQLRAAIAIVPQDTMLFNDTLAYNIAFGCPGASLSQIQRAASIARLHEFIITLPDRYDSLVGERGMKLSGGERQRVSIARAILKSPTLYVFDEATSSLDSQTEQDIVNNLREIARHSSTLVIAHRLSTVQHADEIVLLDHGQIAERGTHGDLLEQDGRYAALWQAQHASAAAA